MDSYDVKLIERPTGATHNVVGAGIQPILDEETGEPETHYVLVAEVDGYYVELGTFTKGYVQHRVGLEHNKIGSDPSADDQLDEAPIGEPERPETPSEG